MILFPHFQTVKTVHHHIFKYLDVCLVTPLFLTLFLLLENVAKQGLLCFILPESSFKVVISFILSPVESISGNLKRSLQRTF